MDDSCVLNCLRAEDRAWFVCVYMWQDVGEVLQRQVIGGSTPADRRQVQVCEAVERQRLQHQLKAGGAQCIVG